jgi:hypothetical protein
MAPLYFVLAALHIVALVVTGALWTIIDLVPKSPLRPHLRDIRAVHFGSLYLVPWFFGLAYALERLQVPWWHWIFFPAGLGLLVFFSGVGYLVPAAVGTGPVLLLDAGLGTGAIHDRSRVPGCRPALDCGRPHPLCDPCVATWLAATRSGALTNHGKAVLPDARGSD